MNSFWSTFHNPPKHRVAITTSLQNLSNNRRESITVSLMRALRQEPCITRRRLEMTRRLAANATDTTTRQLADRTIGEWWPGLTCANFRPNTTDRTADRLLLGGEDDRRMDQPDRRGHTLGYSRRQDRRRRGNRFP